MRRLMTLLLLCGAALTAQATINVIDWDPQGGATTLQIWQFDTEANPALPETDENPYGDAIAKISNTLNPNAFAWGNGMWSGSRFSITLDVPNNPVANPWKEVLVEIIYKGTIVVNWVKNDQGIKFGNLMSYDTCLDNGWMKRVDLWHIEPNPNSERLCYGFNPDVTGAQAAVDSISVSTVCIPEPMTMILLSLGVIALRKIK